MAGVTPVRAVRVEAEGLTTSFRYPHFLVGRQPTFRMPPPATIYGHVCSVIGEFLEPEPLRFGYVFHTDGLGDDLELLHLASVGGGRLPGGYPKNLDVTTNPALREILLHPRLSLYLSAPDPLLERLVGAFREPRYSVTLGRSQDLVAYRVVAMVDLEEAVDCYIEGTLLPWSYRSRTRDGIGVTMPRFINPDDRRAVIWSPFLMLQGHIRTASDADGPAVRKGLLTRGAPDERWWVDPAAPRLGHLARAVIWHSFVGGDADEPAFVHTPAPTLG